MVNVAPMRQFDFGRPMAGSKASAPGELVQRLCAPAVPERAEGGDRRAGRLRSRLRAGERPLAICKCALLPLAVHQRGKGIFHILGVAQHRQPIGGGRLGVATARALDLRLYVVEVEQPPPQPEWRIGGLTDVRQLVGPLT